MICHALSENTLCDWSCIIFAKRAVFLNSYCSSSYFTLGISFNACNEVDEAISSMKKSFQLNHDNAPALLQLGNLYKDKKLFSKALDIYRKYQKLTRNQRLEL